ncbi:hypothetical protein E4H12_01860 [Candidatus Thorarchaeota archaeon]|nr:MAG: hypothetical protein E4H12_01860 [Candidatus Thorarchaeota archaeon]
MKKTQAELDVIVANTISTLGYFKDIERVKNATNEVEQLVYFGVKYTSGMKYFLSTILTRLKSMLWLNSKY